MQLEIAKDPPMRRRRQRAQHTNSHTGCLTCKTRKVKCDELKPVCGRCHKAGRVCRSDHRPVNIALPGTNPTFMVDLRPTLSGSDEYAKRCLHQFTHVTLPAFARCEPSPLWKHMEQEVHHSNSIRFMALSLGHEHLIASKIAIGKATQASPFYLEAVKSLRQTIAVIEAEKAPDMIFNIVFHCLILVVLQCFRKSFEELNIHLQHGLHIASQAAKSDTAVTSMLLREAFRLLKQYSIAVALFNPLLPQATVRNDASVIVNQALSHPEELKTAPSLSALMTNDQLLRDEEQDLLLDLIGTTISNTHPQMDQKHDGELKFAMPLKKDADLEKTVQGLRARHSVLELAIERQANLSDRSRTQYFEVAEARCKLIGIYLRCRWSGYACNYDVEYKTFDEIVLKIEQSWRHQTQETLEEQSSSFSIGLGTVAPLFYTAIMCRHSIIRRKAIELMSRGPQQDGPWDSKLAKRICETLVKFEEGEAQKEGTGYELTGYIPEHCRVAYYYYHSPGHSSTFAVPEKLRVFRKQIGTNDVYVHEDLDLTLDS